MDDESFGIAMGQRKRADANQDAAIGLALALKQSRNRVADLEMQLAVANAEAAGRYAQMVAMEKQHPLSPLLVRSGPAFKSPKYAGEPKTVLRAVYETAFDKYLTDNDIADPAKYRLD
ncbi:MAG: hypothetical protein ACRYHQ_20540 [Janthinobacterium lividum]